MLWNTTFSCQITCSWWCSDSGDFTNVFLTILRRCGGACRDEVAPFRSYIILSRYRGGAAASIVEAREAIVPGPRVQMGRPRLATPLCTPSGHLPRHPPHGNLLRDPSRKFRAILHLHLTFFRTPPPRTLGVLAPTHTGRPGALSIHRHRALPLSAHLNARGRPHPFAAHRRACAARLRSSSAIAAAEKGALGLDTFFRGHHSPKYFLTAGHLRCLAGLVPWRVSLDGGEGREEGGEARRAPLPLGAWHGV